MDKKQLDQVLLGVSLGGFFLMSISFLLMGLDNVGFLPGSMFWGGLLVSTGLQIALAVRRRRFLAGLKAGKEKLRKGRLGLIAFGTNRPALIADIVLAVGFVATVLALIFTKGTGNICFVFIAVTVFAFCMHCVLNGRIFYYVNNRGKLRRMSEQKRVNSKDRKEGEGEL